MSFNNDTNLTGENNEREEPEVNEINEGNVGNSTQTKEHAEGKDGHKIMISSLQDNKERNSEIKVKFELDKKLSKTSGGYCPQFSEDFLECNGTKNNDEIWIKVTT